jgi:diguanylate cyclase (GGDEF)-like protein
MELYYDFILEENLIENRLIYDKERFKHLFDIEEEFKCIEDMFWYMVTNHVHKEDLEKVDVFRKIDVEKRMEQNEYFVETEFRIRLKMKGYRWVSMVTIFLFDDNKKRFYSLVMLKDINKKKLRELENTILARRDGMTRLYNKIYAENVIKDEVGKLKEGANAAFIIVDIDDFKTINDTYGHMVGDHVIIEFSSRLMTCTRETDIVGRIGGDEFLVFVPDFGDDNRLINKITTMQETLCFECAEISTNLRVHCSIGVAIYDSEKNDYVTLFQCADKALYESKKAGKGAFHIYE